MTKNIKTIIYVIIALIIIYVGYTLLKSPAEPQEQETIKIGAIYPLTGPGAFLGEGNKIGAEIAAKAINDSGGINGKTLKVLIEDSQSDPKIGLSAFQKLVGVNGVQAILSTLSSVALSIRPEAENKQIVILAESSHPHVANGFDYTFRNFYTTNDANDLLLNFIQEKNINKVAILHMNDDFGNSAAEGLKQKSKNMPFGVTLSESFDRSYSDVRTQLTKIKNSNPELLYIVGFGSVVATAYNQAQELGIDTLKIGFIICGQPNILQSATTALEDTFSLDPFIDKNSPKFKELESIYRSQFPDRPLDQEVIVAFDGVNLLAGAIKASDNSGEKIKNYLIEQGKFNGASGTINFDQNGDSKRPMQVMQINNGRCAELN